MILEDAHGRYLDRRAFEAAYRALMPHIKAAQARGHVAGLAVAAVIRERTQHGLTRVRAIAECDGDQIDLAVRIRNAQQSNIGTVRAVANAVGAAAEALVEK